MQYTMLPKQLHRPQTNAFVNIHEGPPGPKAEVDEWKFWRENLELPEWQVLRSKSKGFPYWYNRKTGESRWLPPEQSSQQSMSAHATNFSLRLGDKSGNAEDRLWFSYHPGYQVVARRSQERELTAGVQSLPTLTPNQAKHSAKNTAKYLTSILQALCFLHEKHLFSMPLMLTAERQSNSKPHEQPGRA